MSKRTAEDRQRVWRASRGDGETLEDLARVPTLVEGMEPGELLKAVEEKWKLIQTAGLRREAMRALMLEGVTLEWWARLVKAVPGAKRADGPVLVKLIEMLGDLFGVTGPGREFKKAKGEGAETEEGLEGLVDLDD